MVYSLKSYHNLMLDRIRQLRIYLHPIRKVCAFFLMHWEILETYGEYMYSTSYMCWEAFTSARSVL